MDEAKSVLSAEKRREPKRPAQPVRSPRISTMGKNMKTCSRIVLLLVVAVVMAMGAGCGGGAKQEPGSVSELASSTDHSTSNVNDPLAVAALPEWAQLSDEEIANIRRVYFNVPPDIAVDRSKSERVDCVNCAVIVYGHILRPPFYLTKTDKAIYINGYQWSPTKPFPEIWDKRKLDFAETEMKRVRVIKEKCRTVDHAASRRAFQIATEAADDRHNEKWIRKALANDRIPIEKVIIGTDGSVDIYFTLPCSGSPRGVLAGRKRSQEWAMAAGSGRTNDGNNSSNNNQYTSLRASIRDGRLVIATTYFGPMEDLNWIISLLDSNADDRTKLYRLEQKILSADSARALFANQQ